MHIQWLLTFADALFRCLVSLLVFSKLEERYAASALATIVVRSIPGTNGRRGDD
jgi:hypothetical protein